MKGKFKVFIHYLICGVLLTSIWYFSVRYNRSFEFDVDELQILNKNLDNHLENGYIFNMAQLQDTFQNPGIKDNLKQFIEKFFKKNPTPKIYIENNSQLNEFKNQQKNLNYKQLVTFTCENGQNIIVNPENIYDITINMNCEEISEQEIRRLVQELKRILESLSIDFQDVYYSFYDELNILDLYYLGFDKNTEELQKFKNLAQKTILQFQKSLDLNLQNLRINNKSFLENEFRQLDQIYYNKSNQEILTISKEELDEQIIQQNILTGQKFNRINYRHYQDSQILFVASNRKIQQQQEQKPQQNSTQNSTQNSSSSKVVEQQVFLVDEFQEKFDFISVDNYSVLAVDLDDLEQAQILLLNFLYQRYEIDEFTSLGSSLKILNYGEQIDQNIIKQYFQKKEFSYRFTLFKRIVETLEFQHEQPENFIFNKENAIQINQWIQQAKSVLDQKNNLENYTQILQGMENLNEIDSLGQIEAFTQEYLQGVYLPLILPLGFPYIEFLIKQIKNRRKGKEGQKLKQE